MRVIFSLVISLTFGYVIWSRSDAELGNGNPRNQRYLPYVAGYILPLFLVMLILMGVVFLGFEYTSRMVLSMCFSVFLHICVYYGILMPLIPWLRQRISSRACAMLWVIPTYLYMTQYESMVLPAPVAVFTVPGKLVWVLLGVWFIGFAGVLLWNVLEHLRFRKQILESSEVYPNLEIRQKWKIALAQYGFKNTEIPVMTSPLVSTPMTVGLFQFSTFVVLPKRSYSDSELECIFLHEIVHIGRQDSWNKFFLVFCTAMCWFNPLMWIAMRKSADDLELSCDETVLLEADEETRNRYAGLILSAAGDHRGFSTCLSASAEALRYRLKNIVNPTEKSCGALVVAVVFFLLAMTNGYVALAYGGTTGEEILFQSENHNGYTVEVLSSSEAHADQIQIAEEEQIFQYLSEISMYRMTGHYSFSTSDREMLIEWDMPQGVYWLYLYDNAIELYPLHESNVHPEYYYIPDGIDWDYLDSYISTK